MTFGDILTNVYARTNYASSPDAAIVSRIKASVNSWHATVLSAPGMSRLCETTLTGATVASQANYSLGRAVAEIRRIFDTTNDRELALRSQGWLRAVDPDQDEGTPEVYVPLGWRAIHTLPTTGTALWAVSTQAADVGTVLVEGMGSGGYPAGPFTKALTGTTALAIHATTFTDVLIFALSAAQTGAVSLWSGDPAVVGSVLLATIPIGDTTSRYLQFVLWPTPSAVITYTADVKLNVPALVQTYDEPLLPILFHDILEDGAVSDEYLKQDDVRYSVIAQRVKNRISELKYAVFNPPGFVVRPGSLSGRMGLSGPTLGGWYPRLR